MLKAQQHARAGLVGIACLEPQLAVMGQHQVPGKIQVGRAIDQPVQGPVDQQQRRQLVPERDVPGEPEPTISIGLGPRSVSFDPFPVIGCGQRAQGVLPDLVSFAGVMQVRGADNGARRAIRAGQARSLRERSGVVTRLLTVLPQRHPLTLGHAGRVGAERVFSARRRLRPRS